MKINQLTPTAVLDERLSDRALKDIQSVASREELSKFLHAAMIAIRAVASAGAAGNVQCKDALKEILPLLPKHGK